MFFNSGKTMVRFIFSKNFRKYENDSFLGFSPKTKPKPILLLLMKLKVYVSCIYWCWFKVDRTLLRRDIDGESYAVGNIASTSNEGV